MRNQKYSVPTFVPLVLYEQFKSFLNLYFLIVALSQIIPALRIGYLATYIVPLAFVLLVTLGKEAFDDWQRFKRDRLANSASYSILDASSRNLFPNSHHHLSQQDPEAQLSPATTPPLRAVPSSKLKVGDLVLLEKNQRVPADLVLLRTSDSTGGCFIRTDQLDGETDWKLRIALEPTQRLDCDAKLLDVSGEIYAAAPTKDIHSFVGTLTIRSAAPTVFDAEHEDVVLQHESEVKHPISAENVLWSNTVLAAGNAVGLVIYTGSETRAVMNTSHPSTKQGLLDGEINEIAKVRPCAFAKTDRDEADCSLMIQILCAVTFALSVAMVALNGFRGLWYIYIFRFLILFSTIIPISSVPPILLR